MDSLITFKTKKPLLTPQKTNNPPVGPTVVTPDRPNPPSRIRNQNFALSVSDVRRAALKLRSGPVSGPGRVPEELVRPAGKVRGADRSPTLVLPPKYEMLCEFFNGMVSSIRLLRLKRLPPTLARLSKSIETLTDRRFTVHHLAQLKHILPEVIEVKKIRVQDEETNCMKEELLVSLEADAVETDKKAKGSGGYSHLKGIFRSRITEYSASHPEADDVIEGELPCLFYKPKKEPELSLKETPAPLAASITSPSFKRRFSSRALSAPVPGSSPAKPSSSLLETPVKEATSVIVQEESYSTAIDGNATPAKLASTPAKFASTPAELVSTPARLMAATPSLRTPKRSLSSRDDETSFLPNKSAKSLKFDESSDDTEDQLSPVGDNENDIKAESSAKSEELLGVIPENLLLSLMEKERKTLEEQDPVVALARKRQQLMAGVPKLFHMIQLLFQSIRRSVMTKQELIHKLITGHMDIVDRGEVEDQLKLLQEVAPEFLSEQSCLSGDILLRINKSSCADSIRAKLTEAN